ncbi:helix-turn-helix domain-containing protein [Streptomyces sp. NRRL F-5123]|uniref:helix-turn-helix domain-containing protein n=1 Tax=Streptomyces sp. NRRL F-5123 TaxID=1463856 RepID=UPI00069416BF|nr:helix-turn-helix transcriptional regulator [Streptomyces sp. NRRL F-5123]
MGQWEPLTDRAPVDMRRLATQLRRMKDRSGLTVPALAARTAESAEAWASYLAARRVPPLAAVEVLAQASGADYERAGALWRLADKAANGTGERGRGRPVPDPDPLDPLGAAEGLPSGRRRAVLLGAAGVCAVAALLAIVLLAGTGSSSAPGHGAAPTATATTAPASRTPAASPPRTHPQASGRTPAGTTAPPAPGSTPRTSAPTPSAAPTTADPAPSTPASSPPPTPSPSDEPPSATAAPTSTGLCLGLVVLGICIG